MDVINSNELFRCLFEDSNDAFFVFDLEDKTILDANPMAEKLSGTPRDQLLGRHLPEILRVDDAHTIDEVFDAFDPTGFADSFDDDGNLHQENGSANVKLDIRVSYLQTRPKPLGLVIVRDLSEQQKSEIDLKAAKEKLESNFLEQTASLQRVNEQLQAEVIERRLVEDSLRTNEGLLQASLDATKTSCWEVNLKTGELVSKRPSVRWLGYEPEEVPTSREWWKSLIHPDDVDIPRIALERHLQGQAPTYECEYRVRGKSGAWHWTLDRGVIVEYELDGKPLLIAGTDTDITDRKRAEMAIVESEERFRTIFESVPECVKLVTGTGILLDMNAAGLAMIEADSIDQIRGESVYSLIAPEHLEAFIENGQTVYRGESKTLEFEIIGLRGGRRWVETHQVPILRTSDQEILLLAVTRDVTERKKSEEQIRQQQQKLAHVTRLSTMGEMATGLAHELNQPLAAITNYCHACEQVLAQTDSTDSDVLKGMFDKVTDQAMRAGEIIRRMRSFVSKSESVRTIADVGELIQHVLRMCESELRHAGVRLEQSLQQPIAPVFIDEIQVQQVLVNLIRNSLDAMRETDKDQRELKISVTGVHGDKVEISVADTGTGVSTETINQIFDAFFSTKAGGMGMGLAISRTIVESHGGRLWLTPNSDHGVTFHFTVPVCKDGIVDDNQ